MATVLVLRHGDDIPLGLLGDAIAAGGLDVEEVWLHDGDDLPALDGYAALVVLGGEMGVYDTDHHHWLVGEKEIIRDAHERGLPMIGICLGSQLFADALGGTAYLADEHPEIEVLAPELTVEGRTDPVLRHFDRPVVAFHQDTFELPPGGTLLARSDRFKHAFRLGSALAIQAHPEATVDIVADWMSHPGAQALAARAGVVSEELLDSVRRAEPVQREMARRLFGAWVDEVLAGIDQR
jgi:GMP synthase (glutamine-hydrolysing)